MLRQSKALPDNAKKAGVQHIVHLGACGRDDTTVAHWAWHRLVERYIEWYEFSYTHLRPETFMQNVLSYGGKNAIENAIIKTYVEDACLSRVVVDDIVQVAAPALAYPEKHSGQTYRLGYDAVNYYEMAEMMTEIVGKPFRYEPLAPQVFLKAMQAAGAEMAYMNCVYDHWKRYAAGFHSQAIDVDEQGRAYNLDETIQRMRYREGYDKPPVWMEKDKVYKVKFQPTTTSNYFAAGHRIRIEISSSNFPRFDRNLNTGGNNYDETKSVVAHNTVHHSKQYPAQVTITVVKNK